MLLDPFRKTVPDKVQLDVVLKKRFESGKDE